ncbi:GNAT family N-acetyltransferase [Streptosporangium sp. CA-115845]|uniref:GNAT family N-acetyltransferase n=1 Tax=Streptosporangium sp. CA-115845 TaxID=3240071 RepID=UPI003D89C2A7
MSTSPTHAVPAERMASLQLAVQNFAAFWTALARTRGTELIRRPGFLGSDGRERGGLRILLLSPDPGPDDLAELTDLARRRLSGGVVVEDPFGSVDMSALGLTPRRLPIMVRRPGPVATPPAVEIIHVETVEQLRTAESIVVHGFPLTNFQPYRPGDAFAKDLLDRPGVDLFLAARDGVPAGACMTVVDGTVGGTYWVTTLPDHRSHGVGRALMHAVLAHLGDLPAVLSAAKAGKPLYDSLGFDTITDATWWM